MLPHYTSNNIACDHNRSSGHTKKVLLEIHEIQLIRINYVNHRGDLFTETPVQRYSTPASSVYSLTLWYTKRHIILAISPSTIWTHCRLYIHNSQANAVVCELIDTKLCKLVTLYIYYNKPFNHNRRRPIVSDLIVCFDCSLPVQMESEGKIANPGVVWNLCALIKSWTQTRLQIMYVQTIRSWTLLENQLL